MNPFLLFGYPFALKEYLQNNEKNKKLDVTLNKVDNAKNENAEVFEVDICVNHKAEIYNHFILSHDEKVKSLKKE